MSERIALGHTFGQRTAENPKADCLSCGDGKAGTPCCHGRYSRRDVAFMNAHLEAFTAAYLDGNAQAAANELERLRRERRTLPPGHDCTCRPTHCWECRLRAKNRPKGYDGFDVPDVAVSIGRTSPVNAPMPLTSMLDLMAGYT